MAETETVTQERKQEQTSSGLPELVIGLPAMAGADQVRIAEEQIAMTLASLSPPPKTVIAVPGGEQGNEAGRTHISGLFRTMFYQAPAAEAGVLPFMRFFDESRSVFRLADRVGAPACTVLGPEIPALSSESILGLITPCLDGTCDLVMPIYTLKPNEGLLNRAILYPLSRVLYGRRVRFPLALDFQVSGQMMKRLLATSTGGPASRGLHRLPWAVTEAASTGYKVCQSYLNSQPQAQTEGLDLTAVLAAVLGPLFLEMETNAALWQRIRGSVEAPVRGTPPSSSALGDAVDPRKMLDTFQLGFRNLQEIWSLVLPPVSLFELKKLSRLVPEQFRMPDSLWARIVYDFALAHRQRAINRSHVFGALTPLYLGWVASYTMEVAGATAQAADARIEKLAAAYEADKTYLLQRWRWPDRFNP